MPYKDKDEEIKILKERLRNLRIAIYDILVISTQTNECDSRIEEIKETIYKVVEVDGTISKKRE
jgi:hypothetical protein